MDEISMNGKDTPPVKAGWRIRLALTCLRVLAPNGILAPLVAEYGSGQSTKADPRLCMYIKTPERQPIVAIVFDPDTVVERFTFLVDDLRIWAAEGSDG